MTLSTLLIGNESLTTQCGGMLLARGHGVACVITRNADVRAWGLAQGLRVAGYGDDLGDLTVDWLLSVANLTVLPPALLGRATRGAVNFHDGPLPAYAGLNAPVWALLNGETRHGITWHLIGGGIDDGDIVEQRLFDVVPDDTALTLNTRCFEAAMDSFPALLDQLEAGQLRRIPQDFSRRTVYMRADRPAAFGRLDFTQTAEAVARQVRALDHGRYWNPLTTAKVALADRVLNVGAAEVLPGAALPGTVLMADAAGLVVACGSGAVRLGRLTCQDRGLPVSAASIRDAVVPELTGAEALTAALAGVVQAEPRLRRRLAALQPLVVGGLGAGDWAELPLAVPGLAADRALAVLALALVRALGQGVGGVAYAAGPSVAPGYLSNWVPLEVPVVGTVAAAEATVVIDLAQAGRGFALDLRSRDAGLQGGTVPPVGLAVGGPIAGTCVTLTPTAMWVDTGRLSGTEAQSLAARVVLVATALLADPTADLTAVSGLSAAEATQITQGWNQTQAEFDADLCVHQAFEAQVRRSPEAVALVCDGAQMTYAQLNARANRVAAVLRGMGVAPGVLVGLSLPRSLDLVVAALAIQKAGGAYVPMDPSYPSDRIALFIEDSGCPVIVSHSSVVLPASLAQVLCLDTDGRISGASAHDADCGAGPGDLAYMIYTSGSTGRPKGVMVEHRNVVNFFAGMDARIGTTPEVWLAVTSLSFDISVLELFWTLSRGFKVVLSGDESRSLVSAGRITSAQKMEFSLFYWGNDDGAGPKKYELLLEGAKFADTHGFCAVWTPERHFHAFGGPYPNPSVTGAAVAAVTKNIGVRAGSCVIPLHHPARIAEEWAVIDNLTNGRAGLAVASGWHPDDFVLRPENTPPLNKAAMYAAADQVRRLWRGEGVDFPKADGTLFTVKTQPRPVSKDLPMWVTTAGNPDTWREAGEIGAHVLTHLLGQSIEEVAGKITIYHDALRKAGHDPAQFKVTLMLHTFVGRDREQVRRTAEGPMKAYLGAATALVKQYAWTFPAFKKPPGVTKPMDIDTRDLSEEDSAAILDYAFHRYFDESGLFGTVEDALARVEQLKRIGVSEVACLIDYGIAPDVVMEGLYPLAEVVRRANAGGGVTEGDYSIAAQIIRHGVTHLQCTPSMARMIAINDDSRQALSGVKTLMLGGEALPGALVADLKRASKARIINMYGPTETTIWSSTEEVGGGEATVNIGRPLANQQMYVLDDAGAPVAPGVPGELWIGGHGVTRGYWQRPDLTAERFRPDPFVTADRAAPWGGRMYRTGDLVRWRDDGRVDFLGRTDHQVKLRGYRIELGEIEAVLEQQPGVKQAVVLAREDSPGDLRLVAYVVGRVAGLRAALAAVLPDHMVPAHFVELAALPLTPNRKVDRKALPAPQAVTVPQVFVAPVGIEAQIAAIWARVLGVPSVGAGDSFFDLGGHSLLAVQVHRELRTALGVPKLSITDIFRFPTLRALAAHLDDAPKPAAAAVGDAGDRADARADAMARRRAMRQGRVDA